jgi:hypothetical protein
MIHASVNFLGPLNAKEQVRILNLYGLLEFISKRVNRPVVNGAIPGYLILVNGTDIRIYPKNMEDNTIEVVVIPINHGG